jgi:crossover junction endodeoxyribonuclease RusA
MHVTATAPDHRRRDLDNILKALQDSLQDAGVYNDDHQIDDLRITRTSPHKPGWVDVDVTESTTTQPETPPC